MVSVIVCTRDRSSLLADSLRNLLDQKDAGDYEVVVVDNASSDDTAAVAKEIAARHPDRVKYVLEPKVGLAAARNRGVREAQGDIVAFTDDDVLAPPEWVGRIREGLSPSATDGIYGKILPSWEAPAPSWLLEDPRLQRCLALLDLGDAARTARTREDQFFGANFALKKRVFGRVGLFDEGTGLQGKGRLGGEDTDMYLRLLEAGSRLVYDPGVVMVHRIPAARMTDAYFRSWYFDIGRGTFYAAARRKAGAPSERSYAGREAARLMFGLVKAFFTRDPRDRRYYRFKFMGLLGGVAAALRLK